MRAQITGLTCSDGELKIIESCIRNALSKRDIILVGGNCELAGAAVQAIEKLLIGTPPLASGADCD